MDPLVFEIFEGWVRAAGYRVAVADGRGSLTYAQLNARANRLARWLRGRGIEPAAVVGLHVDRSIELVVGAVAVLKAGGAYLPVDPANPAGRAGWMLADAGARLVLCGAEHVDRLRRAGTEPVRLDAQPGADESAADLDPVVRPEDLAYVVYTSGSTGTPKGVAVTHAALAHLVRQVGPGYGLSPADRAGLVCSPSFDVSVSEVWLPLTHGAGIDIPDQESLLSPEATVGWLANRRVTITVLPTPLAERALRARWPDHGLALRTLLTGGDRLHVRPDAALPFRLINNYGPTENTVISTYGVVPPAEHVGELPTIGRPLPGTTVEVLDAELQPCDAGEIYLGGPQLARGYLGRPDLTAERFVAHPRPGHPGERLYRTGDLARRRADGEIEFIGRADDQVKLRGHRIELGEVTAALAGHNDIAAAHVEVRDDRLVGYVAPADLNRLPAAGRLRAYLAERLPAYMVPAAYVILEALPLTTTGKVDRAALPEPDLRSAADPARYVAPRTPTERTIAAVWAQVLGLDRVGTRDAFLDLGGHSLLATQIVGRLADELGLSLAVHEVFDRPTVADLAARVDELRSTAPAPALPPVEPGSGDPISPLSLAQQQVWFLGALAPGSTAYHAQATIRVTGPLDTDVLARALTEITRRHESLRTTYEERDGQPYQVVQPPTPYPLRVLDLDRPDRLADLVCAELDRPFELDRLPLSRWTVARLGPDEHELILVEHHLVHDGWSFAVLMRELEALYAAFAAGRPSPLPEPTIQYRDYVRWQQKLIAGPVIGRQLDYWRKRLAGARELSLPTDRPRPTVQGFRGAVLRLEVPSRVATSVREASRRAGVSPFMTMYAAFVALLHRYTGETDVCVASGFANRRPPETEGLIGMLVNPVVLRCAVDGTTPLRTLQARARELVLDAAAHQECPFPLVVRALGQERDLSRNPLTQVMFSAHDSAVRYPEFGAATSTIVERSNDTAKVDLNVIVVPRAKSHLGPREHTDDRITLLWEYDGDLFDAGTMHEMSAAYLRLLAAATADLETTVGRLPLLDGRQSRTVLVDWNPGPAAPFTGPVHDQVARVAAGSPDAVAIVDGERRVSYAELDRRAEHVAARLRAEGLGAEDVVAVSLPRGAGLLIAELGVLKAGAAFLPIDPAQPAARIRDLVASSGARMLLDTELPDPPGRAPAAAVRPGDLAYVIYTSGSTGQPKGVMVQHDALASFVAWHRERFRLTRTDRTTVVGSPGFDLSIWECWPTLTSGASLHVPSAETLLSPPDLQRWLVEHGITVALLPTPIAEALLSLPWPETGRLRLLHAGGDRLTVRPVPDLGFEVYNSYGPTETTVLSTTGPVAPDGIGLPDIGAPIAGNPAYLLDAELNPVPPGVVGEIYLGGAELARGYLGRPDLTADRFVPDPFAARPGARLYRTGDLGRHRPGGTIEFVGRRDEQVQVRGHRVEPAEVTAALRTHPRVRDAVTVASAGGLVAYVVCDSPQAELRDHLGRYLPSWMMPTAYVVLDALPRTASGKVDRRALPPAGPVAPADGAPPGTGSERAVARIWADVLRLDPTAAANVPVDVRFFDLGGHSLLLGQVRSRLERDLGRRVPLAVLFEHPTVRTLAAYLDQGRAEVTPEPTDGRRREGLARLRRRASLVDTEP